MPSAAIASAILLIAMVVSASIIFNTLSSNYELLRKAEYVKNEIDSEQLHTTITVNNVTYSSGIVIINATNDGNTVIEADKIDVLINGVFYTDNIISTSVDGENVTIWIPEEVLRIEVSSTVSPSRVKVIAHNGISGYWSG
jgi:archaellum component FlaF (FlaF/FlaG flagellin family)